MNRTIFYAKNGKGIDIVVNINGVDIANYYYSTLDLVKKEYPNDKWEYVDVDKEDYRNEIMA